MVNAEHSIRSWLIENEIRLRILIGAIVIFYNCAVAGD